MLSRVSGNLGWTDGVSTAMTRLLLTLAIPATTWACSCMASGPPCEAAWKASAVFLGTVLDISRESAPKDGFLATHVTFQVAEPFIGMEAYGKEVEIRTGRGGGDCGYPFTVGKSYVVYVYKTKEGLSFPAFAPVPVRPMGRRPILITFVR